MLLQFKSRVGTGAVMAVGTEIKESTAVGTSDVIVVGRTRGIATFGDRPLLSFRLLCWR
jgi:hypothetical protein